VQVRAGRLYFVGDCVQLLIERLDHSCRCVVLFVQKIYFVAKLVRRVLQPAHLFFQLVTLGADAGQLIALRIDT
jgi:hypothetical protein